MNEEDFGSDASDEDYVPEGENAVLPSEEESDGVVEDDLAPEENDSKKRRKTSNRKSRKGKKLKVDKGNESDEDEVEKEEKPLNNEEQKKKADSLWADFLKDTDFKPKPKPKVEEKMETKKSDKIDVPSTTEKKEEKKVTITQLFEFAGEEVKVTKEVPADSTEAKLASLPTVSATRGRSKGGGLSSVLNQLGKKQKISTLEKSKLDWDKFKKDEKIEEEIQSHNKGKHGYLERQDFLQRADMRQFEIEKEFRTTQRSHRL